MTRGLTTREALSLEAAADGRVSGRLAERPVLLGARPNVLRSPLVLRCIDDYLAGARHPLSLLASLVLPGVPAGAESA